MIGFLIGLVAREAIGAAAGSRRRPTAVVVPSYANGAPQGYGVPFAPPNARPPSSSSMFLIGGVIGLPMVALGVIGIGFGALAAVQALRGEADWSIALNLVTNCTVLGVVPGLAAMVLCGYLGLGRQRMERLVALAETHGRLGLPQVATELKIAEPQARQMLLTAVERRYVRGRFDLEHGVFLSGVVDTSARQWAGRCPHCSAQVSVVLVPGQPGLCSYCRGALPTG